MPSQKVLCFPAMHVMHTFPRVHVTTILLLIINCFVPDMLNYRSATDWCACGSNPLSVYRCVLRAPRSTGDIAGGVDRRHHASLCVALFDTAAWGGHACGYHRHGRHTTGAPRQTDPALHFQN